MGMKIGLISDTHGYYDPAVEACFQGVTHILHAGDIGYQSVILSLESMAPVTAVLGNTDYDLPYREVEATEIGGRKFFLRHILDPYVPEEAIRQRWTRVKPDVVVFGHSHKPFAERIGSILFVNPGYAGKPRFNLPRSVAVLSWEHPDPQLQFMEL